VDGEGCFNVNIINSKTHKIGTQVKVRFSLIGGKPVEKQ